MALIGRLDPDRDYVLSNHRNHGHYLAFGGPVDLLFGEITGHPDGVCGGRGGSQHVKYGRFLSNGVQGGAVPIGVGIALGEKTAGTGGIVVVCIGDGTLGQGVVYESMNMASLFQLPVLFLVEDNRYAQTTPVAQGVSGSIVKRAEGFGIKSAEIDSTDVDELTPWAKKCIDDVRTTGRPLWAVVHTYRLAAHSKGDDTRDPDELERLSTVDPLLIQRKRVSDGQHSEAEEWVDGVLSEALDRFDLR